MGDSSLPSGVTAVYCYVRFRFGKKLPIWEVIEAQLNQLPGLHSKVCLLQRNVIGRAEDLELDSQGHVRLLRQLREFAQLENRIALVGIPKSLSFGTKKPWLRSMRPRQR